MANYYVVTSGSYSSYGIDFIFKSPKVITEEEFRKYYLEHIKRSSEFDDRQAAKIIKSLNDKNIKSTNYYQNDKITQQMSYQDWQKLCIEAGVERNPNDWLEKILAENGCEVIPYEEFNTDDWD